jgi:hypothetical protein
MVKPVLTHEARKKLARRRHLSRLGRTAHDRAMMVALLLYSYAIGERSTRAIERRCRGGCADAGGLR